MTRVTTRVTGIGGVFFKCADKEAQKAWYERHLGIPAAPYGHSFLWRDSDQPKEVGYTVWSPFAGDTEYFAPSTSPVMVNYRVADLEALVDALASEGIELVGGIDREDNGKFAWILDPEGNKIELWEPVPSASDPYLPDSAKDPHTHHAIDYIELGVTDMAAAKQFYAAAFGWEFNDYGPSYAGIRGPTREVGGLQERETVTAGGPLVVLYSRDLDATVARVTEAGGTITKPTFEFPGGRRFHFADPSGNELAVWGQPEA